MSYIYMGKNLIEIKVKEKGDRLPFHKKKKSVPCHVVKNLTGSVKRKDGRDPVRLVSLLRRSRL